MAPVYLTDRERRGMGFVSTFPAAKLRLESFACLSPSPKRVACRLQYNGEAFHGWEAKPGFRTVESTLAKAVAEVSASEAKITAASRTDAGTHAVGQVVHFDVAEGRWLANARAWIGALNRRLPADVRVMDAAFPREHFDARRSAAWRRYRYSLRTAPYPSVFMAPFTWHYYNQTLDVSSMHAAARTLLCYEPRDMSAFRKANSPASHTMITVHDISVKRGGSDGELIEIDVRADWFVYGMMRLLTATLVQVGTGTISVQDFIRIANDCRRDQVKFSAPPNGLCLLEVGYATELDPFREAFQLDAAGQMSQFIASTDCLR